VHIRDVTHSYVTWRYDDGTLPDFDSFSCVMWLVRMCKVTRPYAWRDSFTLLVHICDVTQSYSFSCVMWLVHMRKVTRSYVWHDSFICDMTMTMGDCMWHDAFTCVTETRINHTCDVTHSYVWRDLISTCDVTGICVWRDWFICDMPITMEDCMAWLSHICDYDVTHSYVWRD